MADARQMSFSRGFRMLLALFGASAHSYLITASPTTNCTIQSVLGRQIYCFNGDCYDGTANCQVFDICTDPPSPPACESPTQLLVQDESTVPVDAGKGTCFTNNNVNDVWVVEQYSFQCCECPPGFAPTANICGSHGPGLSGDLTCAACSFANETLVHNVTDNTYDCKPSVSATPTSSASPTPSSTTSVSSGQQTACAAVKALSPIYNDLSYLSTFAGALCPTNNAFGAILTLMTDASSLFQAKVAINRGSGVGSAEFNAATTVLASISSFLVGAGVAAAVGTTLPIDAGLASLYIGACNLNTVLSLLFATESLAEQNCDKPFIKRHPLDSYATASRLGKSARAEDSNLQPMVRSRQTGTYNPCSQLLALFPTDYGAPAAADSACSGLSSYGLAGLHVGVNSTSSNGTSVAADTANTAISDLEQFCGNYTTNGQDGLMLAFANMLVALQNAEPYCFANTSSVSSTSGLTGSTSTLLSSSQSLSSTSTAMSDCLPVGGSSAPTAAASRGGTSLSAAGASMGTASANAPSGAAGGGMPSPQQQSQGLSTTAPAAYGTPPGSGGTAVPALSGSPSSTPRLSMTRGPPSASAAAQPDTSGTSSSLGVDVIGTAPPPVVTVSTGTSLRPRGEICLLAMLAVLHLVGR